MQRPASHGASGFLDAVEEELCGAGEDRLETHAAFGTKEGPDGQQQEALAIRIGGGGEEICAELFGQSQHEGVACQMRGNGRNLGRPAQHGWILNAAVDEHHRELDDLLGNVVRLGAAARLVKSCQDSKADGREERLLQHTVPDELGLLSTGDESLQQLHSAGERGDTEQLSEDGDLVLDEADGQRCVLGKR